MAKEALAEGKCVVVGLQSTGEATQDAALEAMEVRVRLRRCWCWCDVYV